MGLKRKTTPQKLFSEQYMPGGKQCSRVIAQVLDSRLREALGLSSKMGEMIPHLKAVEDRK